ncbi:flippase [Candidatus Uhrbacteria bacterium]|nr:flippase [Candidatus Uhrbacteria bacterium]
MIISLSRSIAYNALLQLIAKIVGTLFAIVAFGLMARYLDTDGFGAYTTITAFLQFFGILVDMGLTVIAIQMVSETGYDHQKNFRNLFTIRLISGVFIYLLAPLVVLILPYPEAVKFGVLVMAPSFFISSLIQISTVPYQAGIKMRIPVIAEIASKFFLIGGIAAVAASDLGLVGILVMILLNNLIQWVILLCGNRSWYLPPLAFDWDVWRDIASRTWPIALSIVCNVVYMRADTIVLSLSQSQGDVGIYGAAFRVLEVMMTLPLMFIGLTISSFARAWSSGDRVTFARYFQKSFDVMALAAFPLVVGTWFVGTELMVAITGPSFYASGAILKLLMIAVGAVFFGSLFGNLINVIHAQRTMLVGYGAVALGGLLAYLYFIPLYSYWAAALITIVTEMLIALFGFSVFYAKTRVMPSLALCAKALMASGAMGIFLYAFPLWPSAVKVLAGALVYIIVLFLTGALTRELVASLLPEKRI